ncbi:excinuclease ABC, A subunit, partial [mine drainage metagenome]
VLAVKVADMNIFELCEMPVLQSFEVLKTLKLSEREEIVGTRVLKEINSRLQFLCDVGLDYLSLSRRSATLAGGEATKNSFSQPDRKWFGGSSICIR